MNLSGYYKISAPVARVSSRDATSGEAAHRGDQEGHRFVFVFLAYHCCHCSFVEGGILACEKAHNFSLRLFSEELPNVFFDTSPALVQLTMPPPRPHTCLSTPPGAMTLALYLGVVSQAPQHFIVLRGKLLVMGLLSHCFPSTPTRPRQVFEDGGLTSSHAIPVPHCFGCDVEQHTTTVLPSVNTDALGRNSLAC